MDRIKTIISNNEKKHEQDIFMFMISFAFKMALSLLMAVMALKYYTEKDFASAVFETVIVFMWIISMYIDIDILLLKLKNNNKMMSIFIKHEVLLEIEKVINTAENAIETAQIETEE